MGIRVPESRRDWAKVRVLSWHSMSWDLELVLTKNLPSSSCEVELVAGTGQLQSQKDGFVASRPSLWIQRTLNLQLVLRLLWGFYEAKSRHFS